MEQKSGANSGNSEISFVFPYDILSSLLIKRMRVPAYFAGIIVFLVLNLPILIIVSISERLFSSCFSDINCGIGLLDDRFWLKINLVIAIPTVLLFFLIPGWIQNGIQKKISGIDQKYLEIFKSIKKIYSCRVWSFLLAIIPGYLMADLSSVTGVSWQYSTFYLPLYIIFFWVVVFAMLILNLFRILLYFVTILLMERSKK